MSGRLRAGLVLSAATCFAFVAGGAGSVIPRTGSTAQAVTPVSPPSLRIAAPARAGRGKRVTVRVSGRNRRQGFVTTYVDRRNRPCRGTEGAERARGAGVTEITGTYTGTQDAPAGQTVPFAFTLHFRTTTAGIYRLCSYVGKIARRPEARAQATIVVR